MSVITAYYLSPVGKAAIAAASERMRVELARRRTVRLLEDIRRRVEDVPTVPLIPVGEATEIEPEDAAAGKASAA